MWMASHVVHRTPFLNELHRLQVPGRIQYWSCVLAFRCLHGLAPSYLSETLHLSTEVDARCRLRSASVSSSSSLSTKKFHRDASLERNLRAAVSTLVVPSTRRSTLGDRAFPVAAAHAWNSLPPSVRSTSSLASFYLHLKTHLFAASFPCWNSTPS